MRPCTPTAPAPQAKGSQVAWTPSRSSHQHSADGSSCQLLSADRLIRGWGASWEFGMVRYTLLYLKWITNKDLPYST